MTKVVSSHCTLSGQVILPRYVAGESHYMVRIDNGDMWPIGIARWASTIRKMLDGQDWAVAYVTTQCGPVREGSYQRRPGLHVDGAWYAASGMHAPPPTHKRTAVEQHDQTLVMASSHAGCRVHFGEYVQPEEFRGGDMAGMAWHRYRQELNLLPHTVYYGSASTMVHESLPASSDQRRTWIRLNVVRPHSMKWYQLETSISTALRQSIEDRNRMFAARR